MHQKNYEKSIKTIVKCIKNDGKSCRISTLGTRMVFGIRPYSYIYKVIDKIVPICFFYSVTCFPVPTINLYSFKGILTIQANCAAAMGSGQRGPSYHYCWCYHFCYWVVTTCAGLFYRGTTLLANNGGRIGMEGGQKYQVLLAWMAKPCTITRGSVLSLLWGPISSKYTVECIIIKQAYGQIIKTKYRWLSYCKLRTG